LQIVDFEIAAGNKNEFIDAAFFLNSYVFVNRKLQHLSGCRTKAQIDFPTYSKLTIATCFQLTLLPVADLHF